MEDAHIFFVINRWYLSENFILREQTIYPFVEWKDILFNTSPCNQQIKWKDYLSMDNWIGIFEISLYIIYFGINQINVKVNQKVYHNIIYHLNNEEFIPNPWILI